MSAGDPYEEPTITNKPRPPYEMWVAHCPFRKSGSPVFGTMGSSIQDVVVMTTAEWKRLCDEVPQLRTTVFRVGTYE